MCPVSRNGERAVSSVELRRESELLPVWTSLRQLESCEQGWFGRGSRLALENDLCLCVGRLEKDRAAFSMAARLWVAEALRRREVSLADAGALIEALLSLERGDEPAGIAGLIRFCDSYGLQLAVDILEAWSPNPTTGGARRAS